MRRGEVGVLVHCAKGLSRSATAILDYLMRTPRQPLDVALSFVKTIRSIQPNANFLHQLVVWADVDYDPWEDAADTIPKPAYAAYLAMRAYLLRDRGLAGNEPACPDQRRDSFDVNDTMMPEIRAFVTTMPLVASRSDPSRLLTTTVSGTSS
jgi:hypothetical protein